MRYHIILADPPWQYRDKKNSGGKKNNFGAIKHYPCLTVDEIKNLDVQSISEKNCACFLWTTFPFLKDGIEVIESWGFKYKTGGFTWVKTYNNGKIFFGTGAYAKSNAELCLMGTKGNVGRLVKGKTTDPKTKLSVVSNYVSSLVMSPLESHSKKPEECREKIVQLFGDVSRVELFARRKSGDNSGWDYIGNEIDGSDIRDVLKKNAV